MSPSLTRRAWTGWLAAGAAPLHAAAPVLRMVSDEVVPYVLPPGHAQGEGIDVDIARRALARGSELGLSLQVLPWRRALAQLERGEADLAPAVRRTPERDAFLAFSRPYGMPVRHILVSRPDVRRRVRGLADLTGLRVGLVQGYAYPVETVQAIGAGAEYVNDKTALLRMAAAGRFDAVLVTVVTGSWMVHEMGLAGVLRVHPLVLNEGRQTQFAFSRRSPRALEALDAFNRGLAQFAPGDWTRFEKPYLRPLQPL